MKTNQVTTAGYVGEESSHLYKVALTGLFTALSYVVLTFLQVKITLPEGDATSIHLGNAVCVLGALIMGGLYGDLEGAIGVTIGDLSDPMYVVYAPKVFALKLCIGLITDLVAHQVGRISETGDKKRIFCFVVAASVCGLLFNVIFDPLVGCYYELLILDKPAAQLTLAQNVTAPSINAVASTITAAAIYISLRSVLKRADLFERLRQDLCTCQRTGMKQLS